MDIDLAARSVAALLEAEDAHCLANLSNGAYALAHATLAAFADGAADPEALAALHAEVLPALAEAQAAFSAESESLSPLSEAYQDLKDALLPIGLPTNPALAGDQPVPSGLEEVGDELQ